MRKLYTVPIISALCMILYSSSFGAELLVRAKPHWMDDLTQTEVNKMSVSERQSYEARSQIGDIIVVRPDGWKWGKEECLPNYVVVKVPQITEAEAKVYEEGLYGEPIEKDGMINRPMLRVRKYALPKIDIEDTTLTKVSFTSKVILKIGLSSEVSAPKITETN